MADLFGDAAPPDPAPRPDTAPSAPDASRPLADRLRPQSLDAVVGQESVLGAEAPLGRMARSGRLASVILWGPPGVGKTTIARLLAQHADLAFEQISAIFSGVAELRKVFDAALLRRRSGRGTLLFVDEIHRFNRSQQDSFLPHMETGAVVLVGATTENPSFALNAALLSRAQVMILNRLDDAALDALLGRAEAAMETPLPLTPDGRAALRAMADGDGRAMLTLAEELFALAPSLGAPLDPAGLAARLAKRAPVYDRAGEEHYNLISALHKSVRGSDPDAALYWFNRMLTGGEDPLFIARRVVRMAVEDIGLADPECLKQALAARDAYQFLGSPEGELALAQAVVYAAMAPKSNALYAAYKASAKAAKRTGSLPPPMHSVNAPTELMKQAGYGADYAYDHNAEDGFAAQNHFPDAMAREHYYDPVERGFEREMRKRIAFFQRRRAATEE